MFCDANFAELIGIILGDGNIYENNGTYRVVITGHKHEDFEYLTNYVKPLFYNKFNINLSLWYHKNKKAIALATYSKYIVRKLNSLGLPSGPKVMIIPDFINKNSKFISKFLKGVADTDFSVTFKKKSRKYHSYPVITASFSNMNFVYQLKKYLTKFSITSSIYKVKKTFNGKLYIEYQIDICGKDNLNIWLKHIGFSNPKHTTKIEIWRKIGYYPPKMSYSQRLDLLNKKFYK
ncbi:MAG TPA: LAGLIDADG family homing endonuclease [Candidatus Nanoarchaeia archaeon]|nr:LAGLIDADG family homing endonuclease [Candidatus Nanoarchaeia archaeon]